MRLSFRRVAILGLGVMGGSLARALRGLSDPPEVVGWAPDDDGRAALAVGALTRLAATPDDALEGAGLVVYAAPLAATLELLRRQADLWPSGAVATDVTSLKAPIMAAAAEAGAGGRFIGGHPMTGSEGSGFGASRPDLYRGARVWITAPAAAEEARRGVTLLWEALEAVPELVEARAHDHLMAWASHLPQAVASAVALTLSGQRIRPDALGPGGRDVTRLAGSSPDLWAELLSTNGPAVTPAIQSLEEALRRLRGAIEAGDPKELRTLLSTARAWQESR